MAMPWNATAMGSVLPRLRLILDLEAIEALPKGQGPIKRVHTTIPFVSDTNAFLS
jgi:hypothetical protein